ncbi:MAG: flagellar protein FlaG [Calditrichia bacterium]
MKGILMSDPISPDIKVPQRTVEAVQRIQKIELNTDAQKSEKDENPTSAETKKVVMEVDSEVILHKLEEFVKAFNTKIVFKVDPETGSKIQVMEKETGKLIRQIPQEEVLELRSKIDDITGMLFNRRI